MQRAKQYLLASCIYIIRHGYIPNPKLDAPDRIKKLIRREFPSTEGGSLFGDLTRRCWAEEYADLGPSIGIPGRSVGPALVLESRRWMRGCIMISWPSARSS